MTTVSGVLLVDVSGAVDPDFPILSPAAAARLLPVIPPGVPVRLLIGGATGLDAPLGYLAEYLRPARSIEVVGSDAQGVAEMRRLLAMAFLRVAS